MLIRACIASGILLALAGLGVAQQKPDFSGEWTLNRQASTLSPGAAAVQSGVVRIEHRDPTFRYKAAFVSANGPLQYEYELQSDGRDVGAIQNGVTTLSNLRWEGEVLVGRWRIQRPDGETRISFRHELIDGGSRLRAVEQLRGAGQEQDNVWIFDRR
ncbi:MAG TPA: hypothetical protein VE422_36485 [Terriglobia bacterium]|nr:hypothetical protein [Terriglobia bacterium]